MSEEAARNNIGRWAKSMFGRSLTNDPSGNISVRLASGHLLVTHTSSNIGFMDQERISLLSKTGANALTRKFDVTM
jgi:ribulose-5-phosphate 4-epimerase/fuculose-1-phosphate aldolase